MDEHELELQARTNVAARRRADYEQAVEEEKERLRTRERFEIVASRYGEGLRREREEREQGL